MVSHADVTDFSKTLIMQIRRFTIRFAIHNNYSEGHGVFISTIRWRSTYSVKKC